jgi:hypothetical protein
MRAGPWQRFWRTLRQLFYELTGSAFLFFAAAGALAGWRQWQRPAGRALAAVAFAYALLMGFFGVDAFREARRLR